jgi:hypothetical protein
MNEVTTPLTYLIGIVITYVVGPIIVYKITSNKAKLDFHDKALQNRYNLIYCPLRALLLETNISSGSRGFYWKQRVERAMPYFKKFQLTEAFKRLSKNYGKDTIYAVDYGNFPLEDIKNIVKKQKIWSDTALLNYIQAADLSVCEATSHGESRDLMEREEFQLAEYIWDTYEKLNHRLLPQI